MKKKKLLLAALISLSALGITACGKKGTTTKANGKTTKAITTASKTTAKTTEAKSNKMSEAEWKSLFSESNLYKYQVKLNSVVNRIVKYTDYYDYNYCVDGNIVKSYSNKINYTITSNLDRYIEMLNTKDGYDKKYDDLVRKAFSDMFNDISTYKEKGTGNFVYENIQNKSVVPTYYEKDNDDLYMYRYYESYGVYKKSIMPTLKYSDDPIMYLYFVNECKNLYSKLIYDAKTDEYKINMNEIKNNLYAEMDPENLSWGTICFKIENNKIKTVKFSYEYDADNNVEANLTYTYEDVDLTLPKINYLSSSKIATTVFDTYNYDKGCAIRNGEVVYQLLEHEYVDGVCVNCGHVDSASLTKVNLEDLNDTVGDSFVVYKNSKGEYVDFHMDDSNSYGTEVLFGKSYKLYEINNSNGKFYIGRNSNYYDNDCKTGYVYNFIFVNEDFEKVEDNIDVSCLHTSHTYKYVAEKDPDECVAHVTATCTSCSHSFTFDVECHDYEIKSTTDNGIETYVYTCSDCGETYTNYGWKELSNYVVDVHIEDGEVKGCIYNKNNPDVKYPVAALGHYKYATYTRYSLVATMEDGYIYHAFNVTHDMDDDGYCKNCHGFVSERYIEVSDVDPEAFMVCYDEDGNVVDFKFYIGQTSSNTESTSEYTTTTTIYGSIEEGVGTQGAKKVDKHYNSDENCVSTGTVTVTYYANGVEVETLSYNYTDSTNYHDESSDSIICQYDIDGYYVVVFECSVCGEAFVEIWD